MWSMGIIPGNTSYDTMNQCTNLEETPPNPFMQTCQKVLNGPRFMQDFGLDCVGRQGCLLDLNSYIIYNIPGVSEECYSENARIYFQY